MGQDKREAATCNPFAVALSPIAIGIIIAIANDPAAIAAVRKILGVEETPTTPDDPDALLSKAQLARKLNVSTSTVDRLTADGMPVAAHVGDHRRYRLADVETWLAARGKRPAAHAEVAA